MKLTDFCTYDAVRAVLGVSSDEVPDSVMSLPIYSVLLSEEFYDIDSGLVANYMQLRVDDAATADEVRFRDIIQTYASYKAAQSLLGALPMFAPKDMEDNKTALRRVNDPYAQLKDSVSYALTFLKGRLTTTYFALYPAQGSAPTAVVYTNILSTGLAVNPVTGQ